MFSRVLTQMTHIKLPLLSQRILLCLLLISSVPQRAPFSISLPLTCFKLVVASLNTLWSDQLLVFYCTIVFSFYSNSYELVTVIAAVI
ncbi:unnamed protein product [Hymenolepis diminuta]|uniref:Uncharacterized protein n=1 Tax=Hymenolepis diminuta TaxID=6216 RepID=A0A564YTU4_HYMDI|nr:unnamed protein product [Hymenolepis diminuta]